MLNLYEFILWPNCNNNCTFCHQKKQEKIKENEKINSIKNFYNFATNLNDLDQVLLVGGELFDNKFSKELETVFFDFIKFLWNKNINMFYINTNLIYNDLSLLNKFISYCPDISKLKFTTSFDIKYRFCTEYSMNLMLKNFYYLKDKYPSLSIISNTILTDEVVNRIINNTFEFKIPLYNTCFLPCIKIKKMAPKRNNVLNALKILGYDYVNWLYKNMNTKQIRHLYRYNNGKIEECTAKNNKCGHNINFSSYTCDSNSCFICDLNSILNIL